MKPRQRCLDCANLSGKPGEKACRLNPVPRAGTCGRCDTAFVSIQPRLIEEVPACDS